MLADWRKKVTMQKLTLLDRVSERTQDSRLAALAQNNLATLLVLDGDLESARAAFRQALSLDPGCESARANLACLKSPEPSGPVEPSFRAVKPANGLKATPPPSRCKVALVSFLFNWPSTGGGIVHTYELAQFLGKAGYDVRLIHARYRPWGIGQVQSALPFPCEVLDFDEGGWKLDTIQNRYRQAVDAFAPDYVLVTDSWNIKPLLAEAVSHYPYILRLQAMECLCPLNGVRFLTEPEGRFRQCRLNQLANPQDCQRCLQERGNRSGQLHQLERALSGVSNPDYHGRLLRQSSAVPKQSWSSTR